MADQGVSAAPPGLAGAGGLPGLRRLGAVGSRLFSLSMFLLAARLGGAGAGFFVQLLLARSLPADQLGVYFTATSLAAIAGVLAAYGYPSIATRFVSRYKERSTGSALRAFVRTAQSEATILALVLAVLIASAALLWPGAASQTQWAFAIAAFTIPFNAAFRLYGSLATATRRFKLAYLPDVCLKPILVLAVLSGIAFAHNGINLLEAMVSLAAATVVLSLAQSFLLARHFPVAIEPWGGDAPRPAALRRVASKWRREAHAVLLVALFSQYFADLSILMAGPVLGAAEMGTFGFCLKLAFLVGFFVMMSQGMVMPDIAEAMGKRGERKISRKVAASGFAATMASLFATVACALWGDTFLRLFGGDFVAGHAALTLLVATQLVRAVFGPTHAVLTLLGEQKLNLILTVLAVTLLAVSTALLGAAFGLNGAAGAVFITTLSWLSVSAYALYRKAGLRVDLFSAFTSPAGSQTSLQPAH